MLSADAYFDDAREIFCDGCCYLVTCALLALMKNGPTLVLVLSSAFLGFFAQVADAIVVANPRLCRHKLLKPTAFIQSRVARIVVAANLYLCR